MYEERFLLLERYLMSFVFVFLPERSLRCRCNPNSLFPKLCDILQYVLVQCGTLKTTKKWCFAYAVDDW